MLLEVGDNHSLIPIVIPKLHLTLTICFTVFYSLTFITSYIQLWLVLYIGNKLVSAQTTYFFLCCLFTSQRIVLFCFFYTDATSDTNFNAFVSWLLIYFPTVIQYSIVLLITVFYYKTYVKAKGQSSRFTRYHYVVTFTPVVAVFFLNMFPAWFTNPASEYEKDVNLDFISVRTIVTDMIFIGTISFFVYIYRQFPKIPNAMLVHEAKRITIARCIIVGFCCMSISSLKLAYDISALVLSSQKTEFKLPTGIEKKNFINIATQDDYKPLLIFGITLFLWEVVPLVVAMILFHVQFPKGLFAIGKASSNKEINKSIHSSSNTLNSSSTIKSKFIGVPKYGAINAYANSMETSSGTISPVYFGSYNVLPYSYQRQEDNSYEHENAPKNTFRNNYYNDNSLRPPDISDRPSSYKKNPKQFLKPSNRYIWRSVSNKSLVKNKTIREDSDPRTTSAHLSTANEE